MVCVAWLIHHVVVLDALKGHLIVTRSYSLLLLLLSLLMPTH